MEKFSVTSLKLYISVLRKWGYVIVISRALKSSFIRLYGPASHHGAYLKSRIVASHLEYSLALLRASHVSIQYVQYDEIIHNLEKRCFIYCTYDICTVQYVRCLFRTDFWQNKQWSNRYQTNKSPAEVEPVFYAWNDKERTLCLTFSTLVQFSFPHFFPDGWEILFVATVQISPKNQIFSKDITRCRYEKREEKVALPRFSVPPVIIGSPSFPLTND